jgi:hypothetical protein
MEDEEEDEEWEAEADEGGAEVLEVGGGEGRGIVEGR